MSKLFVFSLQFCENDRDGQWYRLYTSRFDPSATPQHSNHIAELSIPLARRLAVKLCDRYGIAEIDRAGLFCNSPMVVKGGAV